MSTFGNLLIDFDQFTKFFSMSINDTIEVGTAHKKSSSKIYLFKIFRINQYSSKDQKTIFNTFYQISNARSRFLQTYKRFSFSFLNKSKMKPTLSMKFISSKTLEIALKSPNSLSTFDIKTILLCIISVAEGMNYLHNHLIIHGNLCPSNIVVDEVDQFYICDFGLYPIKELCLPQKKLFNSLYKDPSMINNEPSFKTDVYSFGILICQLFLAYFQFKKDRSIISEKTIISFISNQDKSKYKEFPAFATEMIESCLNSKINDRPTFKQIIEKFKTMKKTEIEIDIPKLYNELVSSSNLLKFSNKCGASALKKIGNMYDKGQGVKEDKQKAMEFLKKAADLNDSRAQNNYGVLLQDVGIGNKPDLKKGAKYLKKSAEQGDVRGMSNYALILNKGEGVKVDHEKAEELLKICADTNDAESQVNYGFILMKNNPTHERITEGLKYISKAMSQDFPEAFCTYAYILKNGAYVEKNDELAMEFFKKAADLGNNEAMVEYGDGNYDAAGVPRNLEVAMNYYQLAAINGSDLGRKRITELTQFQVNHHFSSSSFTSLLRSTYVTSGKKSREFLRHSHANDQPAPQNPMDFKLPFQISPKVTLISLGKVVYDRPHYHTEKYIFPVGYQIEREYFSINDPRKQAVYRATILDGGESPIFRVECLDKSKKVFESNKISRPWIDMISAVNESRERLGIHTTDKGGISGYSFFGLLLNTMAYLIEHLPDADKCAHYVPQRLFVRGVDEVIEGGKEVTFTNYQSKAKKATDNPNQTEDQDESISQNNDSQSFHNDETSSQLDDYEPSQISSLSVDELMRIGDELNDQKDPTNAFKYFKEAANRGHAAAYLKCAEVAPTLEAQLENYELAISNQIPGSFSKLRTSIMKKLSLLTYKGKRREFAQLFEKHEDYSDAAYVYKKLKDKINFRICYEKAKQSIENVQDGLQQYIFGLLALGQNEVELANLLFTKSSQNGVQQSADKIKELEQNPPPQQAKEEKDREYLKENNQFFQNGLNYFKNSEHINYSIAMAFFEEASKQGCLMADFYIGEYNKDEKGAFHMKKVADAGFVDAQNRFAYYLKEGIGVPKNLPESMEYYKLAADQGHLESIYEYGKLKYENGETEEDKEEGISYLKRSAEELFPDGLYLYSKVILDTNPQDSKKFYDYSISIGSKLAIDEQRKIKENFN